MIDKNTLALLITTLLTSAPVFAISKCVMPGGEVIFTDMDCPSGSGEKTRIEYEHRQSTDGLRPGERRMLGEIEHKEAERRAAKRYERHRDSRHHVGYGDRQKIRKLEMEKRGLSKSLSRGKKKSYGETKAIRSQIRGIDRQIEQLRAPNW